MFIPERVDEGIIKEATKNLGLSESVVSKIHDFQWKIVLEATTVCNNVEITGLGKLVANNNVIESNIEINNNKKKQAEKKLSITDNPKTIERIQKRIQDYDEKIEFLKRKIK